MIFDWCNKIATDGLSNVFEFDPMGYRIHLSKKIDIKPSKKCLWVGIWQTGSGHATCKIGTALM